MTTVVKSFLDAVLRAGACLRVLLIPCYVPDVVHYEMEGSMAQPFQEFVRMRDELRIKDLYSVPGPTQYDDRAPGHAGEDGEWEATTACKRRRLWRPGCGHFRRAWMLRRMCAVAARWNGVASG